VRDGLCVRSLLRKMLLGREHREAEAFQVASRAMDRAVEAYPSSPSGSFE
jgi:hypothetical protein